MKTKNYSKDVSFGGNNIIIIFFLLMSVVMHSQVRVNFTPREPIASPSTSIFNIKGDFTLIGNTNLTLNNYDVNEPNSNNNMIYVDIDGDSNTFNSSSANLTFSTENGAIPECSKVVFAGLYWTGRSSDGSNSPDIFNVTKNSVTKTFNKRKVKLKGPTSSSYTEITANTNDIYYPQNSDGFMYSAFAEITEYVKANGIGQYTVADIALVEGNGGSTGYYGGWGIIVVYENSKMKWRDITVFDGHAYVQGNSTLSHQIPISGFNAVQTGQVNVKLGLMAGEGDRSISGDYFNIQRSSDNNWQALNHTGNSTNNFFNSSIQTGGNTRNPNLVNNTGLDISMFNIPNPSNSVIANNQTSTTLRYGSTQDTYVIFMAAMAVDAYIPDPEGVMSLVTINGVPATSTTTVTPGQEIEYSIKILNEGTENINNAQIKIQLPYTATFVNGSQNGVINFSPLPTPNNIYFNPNDGPSGTLIWDIGTLPVPATPTTVLGELKYKIKITEDCFLLKNPNCVPSASLFGYINGIGAITGIQIINKPFIQGYVTSGLCIGDPILNPITTMIDATNFINQNCQNTITELVFNYCSPISQVPFNSIASNYPIGTQFYNSYPVNGSTIEYTNSNPFPNTLGSFNYYAVPPNANGCYYTLKINIVGNPTITAPQSININGCNSSAITPLVYSETPVSISLQDFINAGGNVSNNQLNYTISYVDTSNGSCPLVVTRTYTIITSCSTQTITQTFTIIDNINPTIITQASNLEVQCDGNGNTAALNAWLASNGGASASDNCSNVTWSNNFTSVSDTCGATGSATVTFTATDACGNASTTSATFTIIDDTNPVIATEASDLTVQCDGLGNTAALNAWLASNGGASASDACSSVTWSNNFTSVSDTCGATGSATVTFTATDACGNASTTSATFTIIDDTNPVIATEASDLTVQCDGLGNTAALNAWLASNGGASASDACSSVTWSNNFTSVSDTCGATGSATVTFTATDACGNASTTSATFTIIDDTNPVIATEASDLTVQCDGLGNTAALNAWLASNGGASASDACSSVTWSNNFTSVSDTCGATGSATVTFTATDACGNASTTSATFTIIDDTDPVIAVEASDLTVQCDGLGNTAALNAWLASNGGASASDACSSVTWSNNFTSVSDTCGATGSATVTFTATDACGNASTTSATFTIIDDTNPVISVQASDLTVQCDGLGNTTALNAWLASNGGASASDACSSVTWSNNFTLVSDTCGATGSATVTFTATDACGNASTTSATFTIVDDTNPVIAVEASDLTVQCDGLGNTAALNAWLASNGGASASDACSSVTWSNNFTSVSDTCGATGSATVTFTATDACGNASTTSATFTIIDDTNPVIAIQASDLTVQCDGLGNTAALNAWLASNGGASASDACSSVTWSNNFTSVSDTCGATGSATVTFTATDACGNASTTSATFTIIDDTNPVIATEASDLTVQCDGLGNTAALNAWLASNGGASASDACSSVTWSNNFTLVSDTCGATGSATVTFTATDACGNASTTSATFTIIDDTNPVIATEASDLTVQCDGLGNTAALNAWLASNGGASASDACSSVTWSNNFTSVSDTCGATGSATVTFTATDACGNASTTSATFTIVDDTDPVIAVEASDLTVQCDGLGNTAALSTWLASNGGASASDTCSSVTWSNNFTSVSDTCGATGSATVTFTATDACGNASTTSATFTIIDDTNPVIAVEASDLTVQCDGLGNTAALNAWLASNGGASASDTCSSVTWSNNFTAVSDTCGATGSATVTFTATDACGNASTTSATFTIVDDTNPVIAVEASDLTVQCDGLGNTAALNAWLASNGGASASDACSSVTWSNNFTSVSDTCGATGSATVTFTATDACGNASTTSATFTIIDDTNPVIAVVASDLTVQCDGLGNTAALNAWLASNGGASASDACSSVTWSNNFNSVSDTCGATGSATVTFTATDACGNASTTSATFTIIDDTDPVIAIQASDLTVQCDGLGNTAALNAWLASNGGASASDACSSVTWSNNFTSVSDTCGATGSATVTFTATDACGNASTTSATFTIIDDTDPVIAIQASDLTVQCDGLGNTAALNAWLASNGGASASDACSSVTWSNNFTLVSDTCGATGSATVTFTATDACGNASTTSATFTIIDDTNPVIATEASDLTVQCDGLGNTTALNAWLASNGGASASDACSSVTWSNNFTLVSDTCGATGSATVTFTATDACGNASTTSATFTIIDDTNPVISVQASDLTVQCDGLGNTTALNAWLASNGGASASDACSSVTWSNNFTLVSDTCGATGSATVTFTATDACGNASTTSATFTIVDDTNPVIAVEASDLTVQCDGLGNTAALNAWLASNGGASASDACSSVTWSNNFTSVSDTCGATGSATVTFTATDACGNASTTSATFTIIDDTNPVIAIQASDLTVQCDGLGNTAALNAWLASNGGASASDACSSVTWSNNFTSVSDTCGATGSATVTFTATDACGNASTTSATFTIIDDTNPVIATEASDLTVQCDGLGNTAALNAWLASNGGASASDACSSVTWSNNFTLVSDTCGATGSATVTFTATDACGNASTTSATFTIIDDTNPVIATEASDLTVQCDGLGNTAALNAWLASNGGASASDACSSVTWSNNFTSVSDTCGATGSATVTFTATDACGNASTTSATFTIVDDTDPVIAVEASDLTVQCDGLGNTAALNAWLASNGGASASDACSSVTWSNNFTLVSDTCGATGSATVTFTATDACGNASTTSATFTIIDDTDPVIAVEASDLTVQCDGLGNTAALNAWLASNGGASASDACSSVTWSNNFTSVSDTCGATGSATVTFTATDACGNASTTSATFTIIDDTNPVISVQASDLTVQCDGLGNTAALNAWLASNGGASASDACSSVTWSNNFTLVSDTCGATGSATVTFTATDACGNASTTSATFTIIDDTNPVIATEASDLTVQCDGLGNTTALNAWLASNGGASASDACSSVTWSNNFTAVSDTCGATGSATVTFTATDACGNASTTSATFTIVDDTNPVFTSELPQNISVSCDAIPSPAIMTGTDNCSDVTIIVTDNIDREESDCEGEYIINRTWTLTDSCNNSTSYTQVITVFDTTPPVLTTPIDSQISVSCSEIPEPPQLIFTDNCSGVQEVTYNETSTIISIYQYVIVREWIVSDNCGNEANFTQTLNVSVEEPFDAIPYAICIEDDPIDLFTILDDSIPTTGEWLEVTNSGGLTGSIFNPTNVALGYYTLQYVVELEDNTCPMIYEIYLNINDDCIVLPACDITVYNAVSPNDDSSNDFFFIDGLECYPNNTVEIYNRWGILVYDETGYDNNLKSFKGISEGRNTINKNELLPDGTYFYILKYTDEENKKHDRSGYLYLNR